MKATEHFFYFKVNKQWMNPPSTQHLFIINLFMMRACFNSVLFFLFYAAITA